MHSSFHAIFDVMFVFSSYTTGPRNMILSPRLYFFFMLHSVEHEILNTQVYKNIKKVSFFRTQISRECYFSCS